MPFEWVKALDRAPEKSGALPLSPRPWTTGTPPLAELHLWPNRSLPARGFAFILTMAGVLILIPLLGLLGRPALWGLLPFAAVPILGLWWAFRRNYQDGKLIEQLRLWPDRIELNRYEPRGPRRDWVANPHWVRLTLHETGGPVEKYLTLKGGGREVELGAFLSPEERVALKAELEDALRHLPV